MLDWAGVLDQHAAVHIELDGVFAWTIRHDEAEGSEHEQKQLRRRETPGRRPVPSHTHLSILPVLWTTLGKWPPLWTTTSEGRLYPNCHWSADTIGASTQSWRFPPVVRSPVQRRRAVRLLVQVHNSRAHPDRRRRHCLVAATISTLPTSA